ncbi:hypothetical protein DXV76_16705 [Rhodobacteraceae bacterium CCMM004]|nr:hypothetical protein DXV76_16705 [Rhodobacteraceae bacterium CCMM004]
MLRLVVLILCLATGAAAQERQDYAQVYLSARHAGATPMVQPGSSFFTGDARDARVEIYGWDARHEVRLELVVAAGRPATLSAVWTDPEGRERRMTTGRLTGLVMPNARNPDRLYLFVAARDGWVSQGHTTFDGTLVIEGTVERLGTFAPMLPSPP